MQHSLPFHVEIEADTCFSGLCGNGNPAVSEVSFLGKWGCQVHKDVSAVTAQHLGWQGQFLS